MKIYTKKGDKGFTSLFGGTRVLKSHKRIESYGTIDELNSYLGLISSLPALKYHQSLITRIQNNLFVIGSILATETSGPNEKIPELKDEESEFLEKLMDDFDKDLPTLKGFIIPGGHEAIAHIHIARCICRRAERQIVALSQENEVQSPVIIYINRLSDFLFMLARKITYELGIAEQIWKSR